MCVGVSYGQVFDDPEEHLPNIVMLATGGTIASGGSTDGAVEYQAGVVSVDQILSAVPALKSIANIEGVQVSNIGSQDMNNDVWRSLVTEIARLRATMPDAGIVITHGTDTMEETAFFLDLIFPTGAPIVLTGAMRQADHPSADGPDNLMNAVRVAVDPAAADRGVLVVMNGEIHAARYVRKQHTDNVDAFTSGDAGFVGAISKNKVRYFKGQRPSTFEGATLNTSEIEFQEVGIAYMHAAFDSQLIQFFSQRKYAGVVIAGVGNGNMNAETIAALSEFSSMGAVVRASRVPLGAVSRNVEVDDDALQFITAQDLSPQKARILLQLVMAQTDDRDEVQAAFTCDMPMTSNFCSSQ